MNSYIQFFSETLPSFIISSSPSDTDAEMLALKELVRQYIERSFPQVYNSTHPWELKISFWKAGDK